MPPTLKFVRVHLLVKGLIRNEILDISGFTREQWGFLGRLPWPIFCSQLPTLKQAALLPSWGFRVPPALKFVRVHLLVKGLTGHLVVWDRKQSRDSGDFRLYLRTAGLSSWQAALANFCKQTALLPSWGFRVCHPLETLSGCIF